MVGRRRLAGRGAGDSGPGPDVGFGGRPSDAELLRRHVAGDTEAFGALFLRHKDRLWAVALRTVCDPDDAADALQEAMISAFRRAADFRGESAVTTWLHRIVVNAAVDRLRRRNTRSVSWSGDEDTLETLAAQGTRGSTLAGSPPTGAGGPAAGMAVDAADSIETRLDVNAALQLLPPEQRAALVLVDMMGYPVADVADILGVSPGTVKSRCARGRARLLPHLSHLRASSAVGGNQPGGLSVSSEQEGGV